MDDIVRNSGLALIARKVFHFLDLKSLLSACEVNPSWRNVILQDRRLWLTHLEIEKRTVLQKSKSHNCKRLFQDYLLKWCDFFQLMEKGGTIEEIIAAIKLISINLEPAIHFAVQGPDLTMTLSDCSLLSSARY